MEAIYHEQQEGHLCAQHCLNALLQGPYYTAIDLASLASQLDDEEGSHLEAGLAGGSTNMDDTGFFSVQVLSRALQVWGLDILSFTSTVDRSVNAQAYPTQQKAYICHFEKHWLTIRKLGNQWFNLNSLLAYPELLSESYLSEFLGQLQREGYSIFVVFGDLPYSAADEILRGAPAVQDQPPPLLSQSREGSVSRGDIPGSADDDLQKALQLSKESAAVGGMGDSDLDKALKLSQLGGGKDSDLDLALKLSEASFKQEMKSDNKPPPSAFSLPSSGASTQAGGAVGPGLIANREEKALDSGGAKDSANEPASEGQKLGGNTSTHSASEIRELRLKRLALLEKQEKEQNT